MQQEMAFKWNKKAKTPSNNPFLIYKCPVPP